jgi:hypothetical protein
MTRFGRSSPIDHGPCVLVAIATVLLASACAESTAPLATGVLELSVTTTGIDPDPDGYVVRVDTGAAQTMPTHGIVTIPGVSPGDHDVQVSGFAANCTVAGATLLSVTIRSDDTAHVRFAVACSPFVSGPGDIAGVWDWTEHFNDATNAIICDDTGTYVFAVAADGFAGTSQQVGTCRGASGPFDNSGQDPVTAGAVTTDHLQFTIGYFEECRYDAAPSGSADHLGGTAVCGTAAGTWTADRGVPLRSVAVAPASATLPLNALLPLTPVLRNSLGNRVFARAIVWSSDGPTVAIVDTLGQVRAGQPGTARVVGSAEGLSGLATIAVGGVITIDAVGDTYGSNLGPQIDILSLSAAVDPSALTVAVRLVAPPPAGLYGYLDLDTDQNPATGAQALVDLWRPDSSGSSGLGDELVFDFSSGDLYDAVSGDWKATIPRYFDDVTSTFVVRIPVSLLGTDRVNMAVVLGNDIGPTDLAPNDGHLTLGGSAVGQAMIVGANLPRHAFEWGHVNHATALHRPRAGKIP